MQEVMCTHNYIDHLTYGKEVVLWRKGRYYEAVGNEGKNYLIRTELGDIGKIHRMFFADYFTQIQ